MWEKVTFIQEGASLYRSAWTGMGVFVWECLTCGAIFPSWIQISKKIHTMKISNFFPKNKIFIKSTQKSVNLSPSNVLLVLVPQLSLMWGTWGTFIKCPSFWGTFPALWLDNIDHVIKITGLSDVIRIGPIERAYINAATYLVLLFCIKLLTCKVCT